MNIETLHKLDTEYSADSVEWCPHDGSQAFFVCGTYQLEERPVDLPDGPAKRKGRLTLYEYDSQSNVLSSRDEHDTAAILDLKWTRSNGKSLLAAANALGEVLLYQLSDNQLKAAGSVHLDADQPTNLTLAIDWSPEAGASRQLVASDSLGNLSLLQIAPDGGLDKLSGWSAHSFEAWTCAFNRHQPAIVYSGGDDMLLHAFDTRCENARVLTNRSHGAGVTTLLSFGDAEHRLATGSYDEQLRVFDTRQFRQPLAEVALGGGIWRIKQSAERKDLLLCANMYHNFSVVRIGDDCAELSVCAEYFEHKSICYGADWCAAKGRRGPNGFVEYVIATCSFYDHTLCVAKVVDSEGQQ